MNAAFWWATGQRKLNTPPPGVAQLITSGLYGSWKFAEGSGTTTASEAGLGSTLTLGSDASISPTWRPGGGLTFPGPTTWARRLSESDMTVVDGVTLTVAFTPGTFTGVKNLIQRSTGNVGYVLACNKSTNKVQVSMGLGSSRSAAALTGFAAGTSMVLCLTVPGDSRPAALNVGGTVTPFTPNTFAGWQPASSSNLLIGYTFVGDIHYAAVHKRVLTAQEMADMVAYARSICTARGVKI